MVKFAQGTLSIIGTFMIILLVLPMATLFWVRDYACKGLIDCDGKDAGYAGIAAACMVNVVLAVFSYVALHAQPWELQPGEADPGPFKPPKDMPKDKDE